MTAALFGEAGEVFLCDSGAEADAVLLSRHLTCGWQVACTGFTICTCIVHFNVLYGADERVFDIITVTFLICLSCSYCGKPRSACAMRDDVSKCCFISALL